MRLALRIFLILLLGVIMDLSYFSYQVLKDVPLRRENNLENIDLVAVVTGGQGRLREAFDVFQNNKGKYLLVSGVDADTKLEDLLGLHKADNLSEERKSAIYLGAESTSTLENAREIADFVELKDVRSVLLITSSYHYKRALSLLKEEFHKRGISIVPQAFAVESPNFSANNWWKTLTGWEILLSEYFKSLGLRVRGAYIR